MNPSEFLAVLERLRARLQAKINAGRSTPPIGRAEQKNVQSVVGAWLGQYEPYFAQMLGGDDPHLAQISEMMEEILRVSSDGSARRTVVRSVANVCKKFRDDLLLPLNRAYWSRAPERSPAGQDEGAAKRLRKLDAKVAADYEQAVLDIEDPDRISYRGAASELREVLTQVLHILAPTAEVQATDWYKEARKSGVVTEPKPTRAERTKFILRKQEQGTTGTGFAESYMSMVEERLSQVIGRTFARSNRSTHADSEKDELTRLLPYVNALLRELLPD